MSDRRHSTRPTLPEGYQYPSPRPSQPQLRRSVLSPAEWGEIAKAQCESMARALKSVNAFNREMDEAWRAPHENAAAQLKRKADGFDVDGEVSREDRIQRTGDETV